MRQFIRTGERVFPMRIQGNAISGYGILVRSSGSLKGPPVTPDYIYKAAEVLQEYLCRLTDVSLPILLSTNPLRPGHVFSVGEGDENFTDDEYSIKTDRGDVYINGGKRGILYGVYAFLEKYCGLRFFTKDIERVIDTSIIEVGDILERYAPIFEYRELCDWTAWNPDFSVKCRLNGSFVRKLRTEDGGGVGFAGGAKGLVHTFSRLVPPDVYYRKNPELYALDDGVRNPNGLCLSNGETEEAAIKTALEWLDGEPDPTLISVSVNDGNVPFCHCEECLRRKAHGENDTDLLFDFVNRVQNRLREKYPNISVETISYGGVSVPPMKVKPNPGVIVRVCATGCERKLTFAEAAAEFDRTGDKRFAGAKSFCDRLQQLSEITDKIYVWDYPYNYQVINTPFPVFGILRENMRYLAEHSVKGVYINGQSDTCDFTELKVYILSKLLFNPTMDETEYRAHIDDFLCGFYGGGWVKIREYIDLCERSANSAYTVTDEPYDVIPIWRDGTPDMRFINEGRALLTAAYIGATTAGERRRVGKVQLQVEYYELYCLHEWVMLNGTEAEKQSYLRRHEQLYNAFIDYGITRVGEITFLPVVTDFRQSPREAVYWDKEATAADRNNENYSRSLFLLLPLDGEIGSRADCKALYLTNNLDKDGVLGVWDGKDFCGKTVPEWKLGGGYEPVALTGGIITDVYTFSAATGIPLGDLRLKLIPRHAVGLMLRVKSVDAGAYVYFKHQQKI